MIGVITGAGGYKWRRRDGSDRCTRAAATTNKWRRPLSITLALICLGAKVATRGTHPPLSSRFSFRPGVAEQKKQKKKNLFNPSNISLSSMAPRSSMTRSSTLTGNELLCLWVWKFFPYVNFPAMFSFAIFDWTAGIPNEWWSVTICEPKIRKQSIWDVRNVIEFHIVVFRRFCPIFRRWVLIAKQTSTSVLIRIDIVT